MQSLRGQTKSIMVFSEVAYCSILIRNALDTHGDAIPFWKRCKGACVRDGTFKQSPDELLLTAYETRTTKSPCVIFSYSSYRSKYIYKKMISIKVRIYIHIYSFCFVFLFFLGGREGQRDSLFLVAAVVVDCFRKRKKNSLYSRTSIIRTSIIRTFRLSGLFLWSRFFHEY